VLSTSVLTSGLRRSSLHETTNVREREGYTLRSPRFHRPDRPPDRRQRPTVFHPAAPPLRTTGMRSTERRQTSHWPTVPEGFR
jgi:hypothetical protein